MADLAPEDVEKCLAVENDTLKADLEAELVPEAEPAAPDHPS